MHEYEQRELKSFFKTDLGQTLLHFLIQSSLELFKGPKQVILITDTAQKHKDFMNSLYLNKVQQDTCTIFLTNLYKEFDLLEKDS